MSTNPYSLSQHEVKVLKALSAERSITLVQNADEHKRRLILKSFLFDRLSQGLSIVVRSSDIDQTISELSALGIREIALCLREDTLIGSDLLKSSSREDNSELIQAIKSNIRYSMSIQRMKKIQEKYVDPVFGEYQRTKLSELLYLSSLRKDNFELGTDLKLKHYQLTQNEFWNLRTKIEKAAKYYKSSFGNLKISDKFCENIYRDFHLADNQSVVYQYLNKFISDCDTLINNYRESFLKISSDIENNFRNQVQQIKLLVHDFEMQLSFYKIDMELAPKGKPFGKSNAALDESKKEIRARYELLKSALSRASFLKIDSPENYWEPDVMQLEEFTGKLKENIERSQVLIKTKVEEQLEIINARNYEAVELESLTHQMQELIYAINGSRLFKDDIQYLSISAWKNYQFLCNIRKDLSSAKVFLEANSDYAIYRSFEISLENKALEILRNLYPIRKTRWLDSYEKWYFKKDSLVRFL